MIIREPEIVGDADGRESPGVRLLADSSDTMGRASIENVRLPAGAPGAGPHTHRMSSEVFYVVSGRLDFLFGNEVYELSAGDGAVVPPPTVHAFGAKAGEPADILIVIAPGVERFEYFRVLGEIIKGNADSAELWERQDEFDTYFTTSEVWESHRRRNL